MPMPNLARLSCALLVGALFMLPSLRAAPAAIAPRPALMAPRAASSLMLDVARVGSGYVAVGERGQILRSADGKKWQQVPVPVRAALTAISFVDARNGWAVGHDAVILSTRDGGASWALQQFEPEIEKPLLDVLFVDRRRGFAVGAFGLFLRTVDGGASWSPVNAPVVDEDELNLHAIVRLGNDDLLIVGEQGRLLLSTDAGRSWSKQVSLMEATVFAAAAYGSSGALICGLRGQAWLSKAVRDGGWQAIATGSGQALHACAVFGRSQALLAGADGTVLLADLAKRQAQRLKSPAAGTWSAIAVGDGSGAAVLAGERGLHLLKRPSGS